MIIVYRYYFFSNVLYTDFSKTANIGHLLLKTDQCKSLYWCVLQCVICSIMSTLQIKDLSIIHKKYYGESCLIGNNTTSSFLYNIQVKRKICQTYTKLLGQKKICLSYMYTKILGQKKDFSSIPQNTRLKRQIFQSYSKKKYKFILFYIIKLQSYIATFSTFRLNFL